MRKSSSSKGIQGKLLSSNDFIVEEKIDPKFLKRFSRKGGKVSESSGRFFLYHIKKSSMSTEDALKLISEKYGIPLDNIGYAGLKDKFAVTTQYITLPKKVSNFSAKNITFKFLKRTENEITIGNLIENRFIITLHNCRNLGKLPLLISKVRKGFPNYFGPQRFSRNNAELGKRILKTGYSPFTKERTKFLLHAYQSSLFNKLVDKYPKARKLPLIGYATKKTQIVKEILEKENIDTKNFRLSRLSITCTGSERPAFVKPKNLRYESQGNVVILDFSLPKGSYATVLLNYIK